jgi:hypothetical protein
MKKNQNKNTTYEFWGIPKRTAPTDRDRPRPTETDRDRPKQTETDRPTETNQLKQTDQP